MKLERLIENGVLISPITKKKLFFSSERTNLLTEDQNETFVMWNRRIPILLKDKNEMEIYASSSEIMNEQYSTDSLEREQHGLLRRIKQFYFKDYRSKASLIAINDLLSCIDEKHIAISIGGGPHIVSEKLLNLNIGPFPNVDIVGDAHNVPFDDNTVDFIHCEAVLEHLYNPSQAVNEMFRICKPGAKLFICTPFLQSYHGYPNHYQNFTLTGHCKLFEAAGFKIIESGTCVGPSFTIAHLNYVYLRNYFPKFIGFPLLLLWIGFSSLIKPLDKKINQSKNSNFLASTTYLVALK